MSDVEGMALILSRASKTVADLKGTLIGIEVATIYIFLLLLLFLLLLCNTLM